MLCLQLILPVMRQHWNDHRVLLPATACLYHLVRNDLSKKMSTRLLAGMVELLLHVFETAPSQSKLQVVMSISRSFSKCASNFLMLFVASLNVMTV